MSFAPPRIEQTGPDSYFVSHGDDRSLHVEFYLESVFQDFQSKKEGRPIYKDVEFVRIRTPGVTGNTIERLVKLTSDGQAPSDPDRFPNQWKAFKNKQEQVQEGTPLEQWAPLSKSRVLEIKSQGIFTVQQLANLPDSTLGTIGLDGRRMRDMAKAFLDQADKGAALSASLAREEVLRGEIEALKTQFLELSTTTKRGPGRPRKEDNENGD